MSSEKKWTPGPWRLIETISSCAVHAGIREVLNYSYSPGSENRANAGLVAAAPELYEALNEALEDWDDVHWDEEFPHRIEWADKARDALAKARGEQP